MVLCPRAMTKKYSQSAIIAQTIRLITQRNRRLFSKKITNIISGQRIHRWLVTKSSLTRGKLRNNSKSGFDVELNDKILERMCEVH